MKKYKHKETGELVLDDPFKTVGTKVYLILSTGEKYYGNVTEECLDEKTLRAANLIPSDESFEDIVVAVWGGHMSWMYRVGVYLA